MENVIERLSIAEKPHWVAFAVKDNAKKPVQPIEKSRYDLASITDPSTWSDYATVKKFADAYVPREGGPDKMLRGFVCSEEHNGAILIDIDHLESLGQADEIVEMFDSYTEVSQSGLGVHILCYGQLPENSRKQAVLEQFGGIEVAMYARRGVAMTGDTERYGFREVMERQNAIDALQAYFPKGSAAVEGDIDWDAPKHIDIDVVFSKMQKSPLWPEIEALLEGSTDGYGSPSDADDALCKHLAYWTDNDAAAIDEIFRSSGLYREKWEREDYRQGTIADGIARANAAKYRRDEADFDNIPEHPEAKQAVRLKIEDLIAASYSDTDAALLYGRVYKDSIAYKDGAWMAYDGTKWEADSAKSNVVVPMLIAAAANDFKTIIFGELGKTPKGETKEEKAEREAERDRLLKWATSLRNDAGMSRITKVLRGIMLTKEEFDTNRWELNVENGVLDLRTRALRPHSPADRVTKIAGVAYDAYAPEPKRWLQFMDEILEGDKERISYLQKYLGLCLTGDVSQAKFLALYGPKSRNGKTTVLNVMGKLLGSYAIVSKRFIIQKHKNEGGENANPMTAGLAGIRLVIINEWEEHDRLSAAEVKELSGGSPLYARRLYGDPFTIEPQFKMIISTNYSMLTTDYTIITSRRLDILPFNKRFEDEEKDTALEGKLLEEKAGILNWCLDGLAALLRDGWHYPEEMKKAMAEYAGEVDKIGSFFDARLIEQPGASVKLQDVYAVYREWCRDTGAEPEGLTAFSRKLNAKGIKTVRKQSGGDKARYIFGWEFIQEAGLPK